MHIRQYVQNGKIAKYAKYAKLRNCKIANCKNYKYAKLHNCKFAKYAKLQNCTIAKFQMIPERGPQTVFKQFLSGAINVLQSGGQTSHL